MAKPAGNYRVRGRSCGCCLSFLSASSLGGGAVLLHLNITAPAGWPSPIVTDVTRFQWPLYPLPLGLCEFAYVILTCPILSVRMVWCVIHKPRQFWGIHSVSCQEDCFLSKQASQGAVSIQWWVYLGEVGRGAVKNWPCCPKMQNFEGSHQFQSSLGMDLCCDCIRVQLLCLLNLAFLPSQVLIPRALSSKIPIRKSSSQLPFLPRHYPHL